MEERRTSNDEALPLSNTSHTCFGCGKVISQSQLTVPGSSGPYVVERPKVLFNNDTQLYVLWFHLDNSNYGVRGYSDAGTRSSYSLNECVVSPCWSRNVSYP